MVNGHRDVVIFCQHHAHQCLRPLLPVCFNPRYVVWFGGWITVSATLPAVLFFLKPFQASIRHSQVSQHISPNIELQHWELRLLDRA